MHPDTLHMHVGGLAVVSLKSKPQLLICVIFTKTHFLIISVGKSLCHRWLGLMLCCELIWFVFLDYRGQIPAVASQIRMGTRVDGRIWWVQARAQCHSAQCHFNSVTLGFWFSPTSVATPKTDEDTEKSRGTGDKKRLWLCEQEIPEKQGQSAWQREIVRAVRNIER